MFYVIKTTGKREPFQPEKIERTCIRAGASKALAKKIIREVEKKAFDGITTREILKLTTSLLEKEAVHLAARYNLKKAVFMLGLAGYAFEEFMAEIFKAHGYKVEVSQMISGACVDHEIDIVAEKGGKRYMVECKYHWHPGVFTGLKEAMYTQARFEDIQEGHKLGKCQKFDQPYLINNFLFSSHAIQYARCKKMKLLGWAYPPDKGIEILIEDKRLYPITILRGIDTYTRRRLTVAGLMMCKDLVEMDLAKLKQFTGLDVPRLKKLVAQVKRILHD